MYVNVSIDPEEVIDELSDRELARLGLYRSESASQSASDDELAEKNLRRTARPVGNGAVVTDADDWRAVAAALRHGDQAALLSQLTTMAWEQAGVTLPVVGVPVVLRRVA